MRKLGLLLVVSVVAALELQHYQHARSPLPASGGEAQARRALTLLDVWAEHAVPSVLLEKSRGRALKSGGSKRAARVGRDLRRGLVQIRAFAAMAAQDPALRHSNSPEARAVRAAGSAWSMWARALLSGARQARHVADLQATAIRLHQAAYAVVDASLTRASAR